MFRKLIALIGALSLIAGSSAQAAQGVKLGKYFEVKPNVGVEVSYAYKDENFNSGFSLGDEDRWDVSRLVAGATLKVGTQDENGIKGRLHIDADLGKLITLENSSVDKRINDKNHEYILDKLVFELEYKTEYCDFQISIGKGDLRAKERFAADKKSLHTVDDSYEELIFQRSVDFNTKNSQNKKELRRAMSNDRVASEFLRPQTKHVEVSIKNCLAGIVKYIKASVYENRGFQALKEDIDDKNLSYNVQALIHPLKQIQIHAGIDYNDYTDQVTLDAQLLWNLIDSSALGLGIYTGVTVRGDKEDNNLLSTSKDENIRRRLTVGTNVTLPLGLQAYLEGGCDVDDCNDANHITAGVGLDVEYKGIKGLVYGSFGIEQMRGNDIEATVVRIGLRGEY